MVVNNKLKKINIQDPSYYCLNNLTDFNDLILENVTTNRKSYKDIIIY